VLLVAVYYRTNLTMRQLAPLFGISPATVCRVIQRLRPLLALETAPRPAVNLQARYAGEPTSPPRPTAPTPSPPPWRAGPARRELRDVFGAMGAWAMAVPDPEGDVTA
jgi:hypothetical protein